MLLYPNEAFFSFLMATCYCVIFSYKCSPSTARSDSVVITVKHREHGALPEPVVNSVMRIKLKLTGYLLAYFVLLM